MPKNLDNYLADRVLTRQLYLMRFSAGEQKKVLAVLTQMQKELRLKLMGDLTDYGKARVNRLLTEASSIIDDYYTQLKPDAGELVYKGVPKVDWRTGKAITEIDATKAGKKAAGYFTDDRVVAQRFADTLTAPGYSHVIEAYVDIKRPFVIDAKGRPASGFMVDALNPSHNNPELIAAIQSNKYDGLIIKNTADEGTIYLPKAPGQIKVKNMGAPQGTDFPDLANHVAEATTRPLAAVGLEASIPTVATMKAVVNGSLIEGAKSADWWAKQSNDLAFKFAAQVRQGIAQNETMTQIVRRVAGSEKLGIPGIFEGARQNAFALVHTSVMQVAADARLATYKANGDIIKGVRQLSTMDGHTTPTCVAYSGAEWDLEGNPINGTTLPFNGGPPRHWGCRSVLTSITKTFKELGIKGLPELPDTGERASDLGPIDRKTTMDQFLKMHDQDWQDKMLGKGKAQLWRDGKITLSQLVSGSGRELTLEELKAL
jgi:hypothetical protein